MKTIKVFDYFQKFSYDVSKPTSVGAIISIFAILVIFILLFIEISKFVTIHVKKDFILFQDITGKSTIDIHFSLYIPHHPCSILAVDQEDQLGVHRTNIDAHIIKRRVSKKYPNLSLPPILPYKTEELLRMINDDEGCVIEGFVEVNKVPGNIHISYHPFRNVWDFLVESQPEEFKKLRLVHKMNYMFFGDKNFPVEELNSFEIFPHTEFPNFIEKNNKLANYDYYVKILPNLLIAENGVTKMNYQYSLSSNNRKSEDDEMAIIMINYDMSEVTTMITKKRIHFLHFLTQVCAIIGGVFVVFSIINRIILSIFNISEKDN